MQKLLREIFGNFNEGDAPAKAGALQTAIKSLPEDQQEIISLHYETDLPVKAIATKLKCSATRIYSKLSAARFALRKELSPASLEKARQVLYGGTNQLY